jgi:DNA polymerase-1
MLFRAYYAVPPILSQDNIPVGALYGFIKSLRFLLRNISTKDSELMLAVALDTGKKDNFRYKIYSEYKGNRASTPEDLIAQLKLTKPMLDAFGIKYLSDITCEADDVIAAYANHAAMSDYEVVIVSSDKDLMQLISDKITFFDINKKGFCSAEDVYEKFLVGPHQICDYLSMVGDRADNIPGVKGIGQKIAAALLQRFETLDGIYANIHRITEERVKKLLENGHESAMLSRSLVTLKNEIELIHKLEDMRWHGFSANHSTIEPFLKQYSLESLIGMLK